MKIAIIIANRALDFDFIKYKLKFNDI
jgi:hypothetical protein